MRQKWISSMLLGMTLGLILALGGGGVALAHGERAQEGFLRMKTVAWYDVAFSTNKVQQGEQLVITGKVRVLETWPPTLQSPEVGYINVSASGPHFVMKERTVNGHAAPSSFFIEKGGLYEFRMVLEGRTPGYWHVHPTLYSEGAGGLIGPGQWTTVEPAPGGYRNDVTLLTGEVIDLDRYGTRWIFLYSLAGFVPGVWWMLWWTVKHRTVTNLAVTGQIGVNDPGEDIGLITKADHRTSTLIAAITLALLAAGWVYMESNWPLRMPQQVLRFAPPQLAEPVRFAEARATEAIYDPQSDTVTMSVEATNLGSEAMRVDLFTTSSLTFKAGAGMTVEPAVIEPGQTARVTLTIQNPVWSQERLIPIGESQMGVAGLLIFESGGEQNALTIEAPVMPTMFFTP